MFIRKLFKIGDKGKWLFLELLIVFVGVYLAFLFQSYAEDRKVGDEKKKVLVSLKLELETFRVSFPGFSEYQFNKVKEWDSLFRIQEVSDYYSWRYLEPQYNFQIIEYALNQEGTDIIDFALYEELSSLLGRIKQLEHAERLMTEFANRHRTMHKRFKDDSPERLSREADNRFNFYKFKNFARDRAGSLKEIASRSAVILKILDAQLSTEEVKNVEKKFFEKLFQAGYGQEFLGPIAEEYFPEYSQKDFLEMLQEFRQKMAAKDQ